MGIIIETDVCADLMISFQSFEGKQNKIKPLFNEFIFQILLTSNNFLKDTVNFVTFLGRKFKSAAVESMMKVAFQSSQFVNVNNLFEDFEKSVLKYSKNWSIRGNNTSYYVPFVPICQSSGTGKTKLVEEFAKKHVTIFACFRSITSLFGYPRRSRIAYRIENILKNKTIDDIIRFLIAMIERALDQVEAIRKKIRADGEENEESSIAMQFYELQPWHLTRNRI
jgi:hypothetical protein